MESGSFGVLGIGDGSRLIAYLPICISWRCQGMMHYSFSLSSGCVVSSDMYRHHVVLDCY